MAAVASVSYLWVYLAYSLTQKAFTTGSATLSTTFVRNSTSASIRFTPRRVELGYSNRAKMALFKMYSILADQTSGQIFLKTPIKPEATRWRCSMLTLSITLKEMG